MALVLCLNFLSAAPTVFVSTAPLKGNALSLIRLLFPVFPVQRVWRRQVLKLVLAQYFSFRVKLLC